MRRRNLTLLVLPLLAGCSFELVDASPAVGRPFLNVSWVVVDSVALLSAQAFGATVPASAAAPGERQLLVDGRALEPEGENAQGVLTYRLPQAVARADEVHIRAPQFAGAHLIPAVFVDALRLQAPDTLRLSRSAAVAVVAITGTRVRSGGPGVEMSAGFTVDRVTASWEMEVHSGGGSALVSTRGRTLPGSIVIPASQLPSHVQSGHIEMHVALSQQMEATSGYGLVVQRRTSARVPFIVVP